MTPLRTALASLTAIAVVLLSSGVASAAPGAEEPRWIWPGGVASVLREFERPPHPYGPGHRGIDIPVTGGVALAPADGVVAFSGFVVDRSLLTIDHGGGLVSTLEPVDDPPPAGTAVSQGQVLGPVSAGGHVGDDTLHLGARLNGEYIDPLALLGVLERPVLLPCC